jgi:hypothetical protein
LDNNGNIPKGSGPHINGKLVPRTQFSSTTPYPGYSFSKHDHVWINLHHKNVVKNPYFSMRLKKPTCIEKVSAAVYAYDWTHGKTYDMKVPMEVMILNGGTKMKTITAKTMQYNRKNWKDSNQDKYLFKWEPVTSRPMAGKWGSLNFKKESKYGSEYPIGLVGCYHSCTNGGRRPLAHSGWTTGGVADCKKRAKGYKYYGFGCPHGNGHECWRGNDIRTTDEFLLPIADCIGDIAHYSKKVNNGNAGHCNGKGGKIFTEKFEGFTYPLGGHCREPVFLTNVED